MTSETQFSENELNSFLKEIGVIESSGETASLKPSTPSFAELFATHEERNLHSFQQNENLTKTKKHVFFWIPLTIMGFLLGIAIGWHIHTFFYFNSKNQELIQKIERLTEESKATSTMLQASLDQMRLDFENFINIHLSSFDPKTLSEETIESFELPAELSEEGLKKTAKKA